MAHDDPRVDELLRRAAPGAPSGFADTVLAAARARRRRRRRWAVAGAVAAAVAVAVGLGALYGWRRGQEPPSRIRVPRLAGRREPDLTPATETESFAAQLDPPEDGGRQVMMARIDGQCAVIVRPSVPDTRDPGEAGPRPGAMAGAVSEQEGGGSVAARLE